MDKVNTKLSKTQKPERPSPADFDNFLPWACGQYSVEVCIVIIRNVQRHYASAAPKDRPKSKNLSKSKPSSDLNPDLDGVAPNFSLSSKVDDPENSLFIETTYDGSYNLVRIKFLKHTIIPIAVMQIISLIIPFHPTLSSIIINDGLQAKVIYEISKFLPQSGVTEICLDCTYLAEANYHILLDNDVLKHLSLSKCSINDDVVETIASKLISSCPASKSLSALNLSTNSITDTGVKYLAEMLRTNRHLTYLNLADNLITDEGAKSIFDILEEFAITREETLDNSKRLMTYLRAKNELIETTVKELRIDSVFDKKTTGRRKYHSAKKKISNKSRMLFNNKSAFNVEAIRKKEGNEYYEKAKTIAEGILGSFDDPFGLEDTVKRGKVTYCLGNNRLSYLNLAYNDLTNHSLKNLCRVLLSQKIFSRKPKGLIKIRIEGNYLPECSEEILMIDDLLMSVVTGTIKKRYRVN